MSMDEKEKIYSLIPHRPPFLWVDRLIELGADQIVAEKDIPVDLDIFTGHYPDYPIMPGVILCEAVFQAGALLIADRLKAEDQELNGVPVLTRIGGAKFKREVLPGDTITIKAAVKEIVGPAWFMKGRVIKNGKTCVTVDFACTLKEGKVDGKR